MLRQPKNAVGACLLFTAMACETSVSSEEINTRESVANQRYWVEQVADGLNFPSSMVWLPNGDLLVSERVGGLRIVKGDGRDPDFVSGTPPCYNHSIVDGLKEILLDPDYQFNRILYLLLSEGTSDARYAAVYRANFSPTGLENLVRVFQTRYDVGSVNTMFVTRMIFLSDKTLMLGVADGIGRRAQRLDSHMGKILRINRDGSIPKDNPFLTTPGALPEIWSYGHRVPLGMYQDVESGLFWEIESGPSGGDELNVLKAGANYGWAKASWGFRYSNRGLAAPLQSGPGIENPILVWTPSFTPSGLTLYRGNIYPMWNGDFFVGHLTQKVLERLRLEGDRVILQERMLLDLEARVRDVKVGPDGHLYILTDHPNGRVLRLQPGSPGANQLDRVAYKERKFVMSPTGSVIPVNGQKELESMGPDDLVKGQLAFRERCAACHSVGTAVQGGEIGPDLDGVYGRRMGSSANFDYSSSMKSAVAVWDFARLDRFLADPNDLVPGTRMASPSVTDPQVRRGIIGFLKQQSDEGN